MRYFVENQAQDCPIYVVLNPKTQIIASSAKHPKKHNEKTTENLVQYYQK